MYVCMYVCVYVCMYVYMYVSNLVYILVMLCFRVGYRGICHVSFVFSEEFYEENTSDK